MNQSIHEHALSLGPCAEYEFDLVEQSEGSLAPEPAARLQQHLAHCARCRAYAAELAQLDSALAVALTAPQLSADFDARLAERIALLQRSPQRTAALEAADAEHQQLLQSLGRMVDWRTALNSVAVVSVAGSVVYAIMSIAPEFVARLQPAPTHIAMFGMAIAAFTAGFVLLRVPRS